MGLQINRLIKAIRNALLAFIVFFGLIAAITWGLSQIQHFDVAIGVFFLTSWFLVLVNIFYDRG